MKRREFLSKAGQVLVVLPVGWSLVGCDDDGNGTDAGAGDGGRSDASGDATGMDNQNNSLFFTSSVDQAHSHTLTLERSAVTSPPAGGLTRDTSIEVSHLHTVVLSMEELGAISAGGIVNKTTSLVNGHVHSFQFRLS